VCSHVGMELPQESAQCAASMSGSVNYDIDGRWKWLKGGSCKECDFRNH
jgi:hypothetical protein